MKSPTASKYFIWFNRKWVQCAQARTIDNDRLEYVLEDGAFGIALATKWVGIHSF